MRKTLAAVFAGGYCIVGAIVTNAQPNIQIGPNGIQINPQPQYQQQRSCDFYYQMNNHRYTVCAEYSEGRWHHFRDLNGNRLPQGAEVYDNNRRRHNWD